MTRLFLRLVALFLSAGALAQTVVTRPGPLSNEPPLLTFVSPDASLVARPQEEEKVAPPVPAIRFQLEAAAASDAAPAIVFRSSAPKIFIRWRGENLPIGSTVRLVWVAEDVGDVMEPNFIVDQKDTVVTTPNFGARFTLDRPLDGWAAGKYRVDLFVNDALKDTLGVTINE